MSVSFKMATDVPGGVWAHIGPVLNFLSANAPLRRAGRGADSDVGGLPVFPYPNPAWERATLKVAVKEAQEATVTVYDVPGRRVTTLHDGRLRAQDTERLSLNASREGLSSGTYFVRVQQGFAATERRTVVQ